MSYTKELEGKMFSEYYPLQGLSVEARKMVDLEKDVPVTVEKDLNIRIKVIDDCGHACTFCHNEGTKVNEKQAKDRVSVFLNDQVGFESEKIVVDEVFIAQVTRIRDAFGTKEAHLTGGEPTQHKELTAVISVLKKLGLKVKMTSNGETGGDVYKEIGEAGLDSVNISIFGSTPEEYAETQPKQFGIKWAENKLRKSREAISGAREAGVQVKANCVMTNASEEDRITRLIARSEDEGFALRILNNLGAGDESITAIYNLLAKLGAVPEKKKVVAGSSTCSVYYRLPSGNVIGFKQIRQVRLEGVCNNCDIDNEGKCEEGYYGMRLYKDKANGEYKIGVCIQRMDDFTLEADNFFSSELPQEINKLRAKEYTSLCELIKNV
jgi:cyclic pyranopterin phosphate synthase